MSQTYPAVLPAHTKVTDGTGLANTTGTYATAGSLSSTVAYEPDTYLEKLTAHPAGEADRTAAVAITKACNMPY